MSVHHRAARTLAASFLSALVLMAAGVGCSSDDDAADDTSTTAAADDSNDTSADGDNGENGGASVSSAPDQAPPPIMKADKLETALATTVDKGDTCAFNDVINTANLSPESGSVEDFKASYSVAADAAAAIAAKAPAEVSGALSKLADTAHKVVEMLDANGGKADDPAIAKLQGSDENTKAQADYTAWVSKNCTSK